MSDDDLPEFYIEAAQVVVGMHPFPSAAETGIAIEAVRRTILQARSQAFEEAASYHDDKAAEHEAFRFDAKGELIDHHTKMVRFHLSSAQAIRQHSQKGRENG